jgi:hypothetical protein
MGVMVKKFVNAAEKSEYETLLNDIRNNNPEVTDLEIAGLDNISLVIFLNAIENNHIIINLDFSGSDVLSVDGVRNIYKAISHNYYITSVLFDSSQTYTNQSINIFHSYINKIIRRNLDIFFEAIDDLFGGRILQNLQFQTLANHLMNLSDYKEMIEMHGHSLSEVKSVIKHYADINDIKLNIKIEDEDEVVASRVIINDQTYDVIDVPKDGNCFFSAMARLIGGNQQTLQENYELSSSLRDRVVDHIIYHPHMYNFETIPRISGYSLGNSVQAYILKMSKNGTWADHMAIQAMANLGYHINIHDNGRIHPFVPGNNNIEIGEGEALNLQYVNNNHFRALVRYSESNEVGMIDNSTINNNELHVGIFSRSPSLNELEQDPALKMSNKVSKWDVVSNFAKKTIKSIFSSGKKKIIPIDDEGSETNIIPCVEENISIIVDLASNITISEPVISNTLPIATISIIGVEQSSLFG